MGKEPKERGPLDKSKRVLISSTSVGGTVIVSRRDTIAWVKPDEDIDHPKFAERQDLFLHKEDVEGDEFPKVGATVLFSVYEDENGLGAESCQVLEQGDGTLSEELKAVVNKMKRSRDRGKKKEKKKEEKKTTSNVKVG